MITKPTVLILGAGASIPHGFPSGANLLKQIDEGLHPSNVMDWAKIFDACGVHEDERQTFRKDLIYSQQSSVDAFLEHRPEFLKVGKLAITLALKIHEDENHLLEFKSRNSCCYQYLFSKMNVPFGDFDKNVLSIITFNYDRSIEHYLFKALKYSYNKSDIECAKKLNIIPFVHVHGSFVPLPWQSDQGKPYTRSYTPEDIFASSEKIIVISEGQETSPEFERAFTLMEKAERIYFLGFGYNSTNLKRLGVDRLPQQNVLINWMAPSSSPMMGTALGMEDSEIQSVQSKWKIILPDNKVDCLLFLRRFAQLD